MSFVKFLNRESKYLYNIDFKSVLMWVRDQFTVTVQAEVCKRPRDLRPYLRPYGDKISPYKYEGLHISLVSKGKEIIANSTNCRDYFNEVIRWFVTGGRTRALHCNQDYEGMMDRNNLRIVLFIDLPEERSPLDGIKNGLRLANMYGRVAGWRKLRLARCLLPRGEHHPPLECYVIVGDKNWQRTPQFISMLILLIRVCLYHEVPSWIQDAYSLQGYWHEILGDARIRGITNDFFDFLYNSYDKLLTLVANEREIFPHDQDGGYHIRLDNFHLKSGLNSLVKNYSPTHPKSATILRRLYMEECKNAGKRH